MQVLEHEITIKRFLYGAPDYIALCHWNAEIDNAWFWRDRAGRLQCGLLDWGRVGQLNVAFALWGCLGDAPLEIWNWHFDELLDLFVAELRSRGGPSLDGSELKLHLQRYIAFMGVAYLEAPTRILGSLPGASEASGPADPVFRNNETARGFLGIFTAFLHLWQTHDFGKSLDRLIGHAR